MRYTFGANSFFPTIGNIYLLIKYLKKL